MNTITGYYISVISGSLIAVNLKQLDFNCFAWIYGENTTIALGSMVFESEEIAINWFLRVYRDLNCFITDK